LTISQNNPSVSSETSLQLGGDKGSTLDLTGLTEEQIQALKIENAQRSIDVVEKGQKIAIDAKALDLKLGTMSEEGKRASEAGLSVNITNTKEDEMGRTEIIMGNTEASAKGQLTWSQMGNKDNTLVWLVLILIALGIIAGTLIYLFGPVANA
jgi:hypothetical protein